MYQKDPNVSIAIFVDNSILWLSNGLTRSSVLADVGDTNDHNDNGDLTDVNNKWTNNNVLNNDHDIVNEMIYEKSNKSKITPDTFENIHPIEKSITKYASTHTDGGLHISERFPLLFSIDPALVQREGGFSGKLSSMKLENILREIIEFKQMIDEPIVYESNNLAHCYAWHVWHATERAVRNGLPILLMYIHHWMVQSKNALLLTLLIIAYLEMKCLYCNTFVV